MSNSVLAVSLVVGRLQSVDGIGKVYNMLGNPTSEKGFKDRYSDGTKILAWEITREGSHAAEEVASAMARTEQIVIYGYMSAKDGDTEPKFQALVDSICDKFDPPHTRTFDGQCDWSGPLDVDGPKYAFKGNALVHFVRMVYPVRFYPIV